MAGSDPLERNGMELTILLHLQDKGHPVLLSDLKVNLVPDKQETIVCSVFDLRDDSLVSVREIGCDNLVAITPLGQSILLKILSGSGGC